MNRTNGKPWTKVDRRPGGDGSVMASRARHHLIELCPYAYCFRELSFGFSDGVLTIRGRVNSFYMKQVLQTMLKSLDGVERIDNCVDVVNPQGLSSIRAE